MSRKSAREAAFVTIFEMGFESNPPEQIVERRVKMDREKIEREEDIPTFGLSDKDGDYIQRTVSGISTHLDELDMYIQKYSVDWNFGRISRVAAAILRLAMYEIIYIEDVPPAAAANEAVELAKRYDDEKTASFINGILGTFISKEIAGD